MAVVNEAEKKRKKPKLIRFNVGLTKYDIVRESGEYVGFKLCDDPEDTDCFLFWSDLAVADDYIAAIDIYQKVNHFPGSGEITRKDNLARNVARLQKLHPSSYNFTPRSWILPAEETILLGYHDTQKHKGRTPTYIYKPPGGAQGKGISLTHTPDQIDLQGVSVLVQEYITRPFLIDGLKFDLRIYVLVTSCDPLRLFVYRDGLVRLATAPYLPPAQDNLHLLNMHLTNYAINKGQENFDATDSIESGSKRTIAWMMGMLEGLGHDSKALWQAIDDVLIKTVLLAQPYWDHQYRIARRVKGRAQDLVDSPTDISSNCFEILGFDVMIDEKLRPIVLEVNRAPSLGTDSKLDHDIKHGVLTSAFKLLRIRYLDKKHGLGIVRKKAQERLFNAKQKDASEVDDDDSVASEASKIAFDQEAYENKHCGLYERVYPTTDDAKAREYATILASGFESLSSTMGMGVGDAPSPASAKRAKKKVFDFGCSTPSPHAQACYCSQGEGSSKRY